MPDSGGPPQCNPACQKIILDGDLLGAVFLTTGNCLLKFRRKLDFAIEVDQSFEVAVAAAYKFIRTVRLAINAEPVEPLAVETGTHMAAVIEDTCQKIEAFGRPIHDSEEVIESLIDAENLAFTWQRCVLTGMGWQGPWPHCLR